MPPTSRREFRSRRGRGRNAYLLHTALMEFPTTSGVVALGIHAGTGYVDCGSEFLSLMQRSYNLHTGGRIAVVAPFLKWTKDQLFVLAAELNVPVGLTYSCESASFACGECPSCLDRSHLVEGASMC